MPDQEKYRHWEEQKDATETKATLTEIETDNVTIKKELVSSCIPRVPTFKWQLWSLAGWNQRIANKLALEEKGNY